MTDFPVGRRYHANPSQGAADAEGVRPWLVWDLAGGLTGDGQSMAILYVGPMEECGMISDVLEARRWQEAGD